MGSGGGEGRLGKVGGNRKRKRGGANKGGREGMGRMERGVGDKEEKRRRDRKKE